MIDSQKESKVNEADEDSDADVMLDLQKSKNKENISEEHQENDVAEITNMITQIDLHTDNSDDGNLKKKSDLYPHQEVMSPMKIQIEVSAETQ